VLILGISGSPRKGANTDFCVQEALKTARAEGAETEFISLAGLNVAPCSACDICEEIDQCSIDDDMGRIYPLLDKCAGLIVGSPVYMVGLTAQLKAFMDRSVLEKRNGFRMSNKPGGAIAVAARRNGGLEITIQEIHAWMLDQDMLVVGDGPPYSHMGGTVVAYKPGEAEGDDWGLETVRGVGRRVATVARLLGAKYK